MLGVHVSAESGAARENRPVGRLWEGYKFACALPVVLTVSYREFDSAVLPIIRALKASKYWSKGSPNDC